MTMELEIYVQPGAKQTVLSGTHDGRLKIRLNASPVEGKANQELIRFMADLLKLRKQDIQIIRGEKSRIKCLSFPENPAVVEQLKQLGI